MDDITNLLKRTGANSIAELQASVFFAVKKPGILGGKAFRPGIPAKWVDYAESSVDGEKKVTCVVLKYLDGMQHTVPVSKLLKECEILDPAGVTKTFIKRSELDK